MSQPGPSLENVLVAYTDKRGPVSPCPAPKHTSALLSFLAKRRDFRVSAYYGGLEAMLGAIRDRNGSYWLPVIPVADSGGWQDADRHLPQLCLPQRIPFSFFYYPVSLSSVSFLLIFFYPVLPSAGWPRKSGKQFTCPQPLPWAYIAQVSLCAHLSRDGAL